MRKSSRKLQICSVYLKDMMCDIYSKNYEHHKEKSINTHMITRYDVLFICLGGFDPGWHGMEFLMCFTGMEVDP